MLLRVRAQTLATAAQLLTFLAAFLGLFARVWYLTAISGGLALLLYIGSLVLGNREKRAMQSSVDRLVEAVDLDHVLRETAQSLGLGEGGAGWRLTLYRLDFSSQSDGGRWKLEARAANQRAYEISGEYVELAPTQGVLRIAMSSADQAKGGIDEMPTVPDPANDPDGWRTVMSAWGLADETSPVGMASRAYCGRVFRVGLHRGRGRDMTLGLVAESLSPGGVKRQAVEEILTRPVFELLYELIRLKEDMRASLFDLGQKSG
ncbi:hypothetical protein GCM10027039_39760 [Terrabacter koreensis]